jgi:DMSO/TMAO reductase YedYZ heme-binding membrane subunit
MKLHKILFIILGIIFGIMYIVLANSIKSTAIIWIATRALGIVAYFLLFALITLGELKLLGFTRLFKFHCTLGIITFYIAFLHGVSAVFEKFKWGKNLNLTDYLGFNFSDKWLAFMSLGTLAFYIIIFVSATSSSSAIKGLGFRKWKIIHYASYISLVAVFLHSTFIGTDLKTSEFRVILFPVIIFMFSFVIGLYIIRLIKNFFPDKNDLIFAILSMAVICASTAYFSNSVRISNESYSNLLNDKEKIIMDISALMERNDYLASYLNYLNSEIKNIQNSSDSIQSSIYQAKGTAGTGDVQNNIVYPKDIYLDDKSYEEGYEVEDEEDD